MKPGVYQIDNRTTGKKYIGSSSDTHKRLSQHWSMLNNGKHPNEHLMHAWRKYGERDFDFEVIKHFDTKEEALAYEQQLLDEYRFSNRWDELYNIAREASTPTTSPEVAAKISKSKTGFKFSEEAKVKMSAAAMGRKQSPEAKANQIAAQMGRKLSQETIEKIRQSNLGQKRSEDAKRKMSEAKLGKSAPNKGKILSKETKCKMSDAKLGKKMSEETRAKMSHASKNISDERRENQRNGVKLWWEKRKAENTYRELSIPEETTNTLGDNHV